MPAIKHVDIWLDSLTVNVGLEWTEGDLTVVRGLRMAVADPTVLPTDWIGTHVGTIVDRDGDEVADITVVVADDAGVLTATFTVDTPTDVPAGEYSWSAVQNTAGLVRFARSPVRVNRD